MQNEILEKVLETDAYAIPRYNIEDSSGKTIFSNVALKLQNAVKQVGTRFATETMLANNVAQKMNLDPATSTPNDAFNTLADRAPVGTVLWYASSVVPSGYLICDGSLVSRTNYAVLFKVIGTSFGAGDGSTTFALPDLRAAFIRGAGTKNNYAATFAKVQEASKLLQVPGFSTFIRSVSDYDYTASQSADNPGNNTNASFGNGNATGNKNDYAVRPYNVALTPIIKY